MHLTVRPKLTTSKKNRHLPMIFYYGGGHGQKALYFSKVNPVAAVIAVDVRTELQKHQEILRLIQHYRSISLIESETANSLIAAAYPDDTSVLKKIGNCSAQKGMGARGELGALGIAAKLNPEEINETLNWLRTRCIQDNGGILAGLTAAWLGSIAGGTNSKSQRAVAQLVIDLGNELDLPVEIDFHVTDSITFTGLGSNIHTNCAVALHELNKFVLKSNQKPGSRAVVTARIATLPPVGTDHILRQELDLLDKQAWFSTELQDSMVMIGPNAALCNSFGNISHSSTDYFRSIPRQQVAGQIAAGYHEDMEMEMDRIQPTPHLVTHFNSGQVDYPIDRPSINELIDRINSLDADGFNKGCEAKGTEIDYTLTVFDLKGRQYDCERLPDHFANSVETLTEAVNDLILITTIGDLLGVEEAENKWELQKIEAELNKKS